MLYCNNLKGASRPWRGVMPVVVLAALMISAGVGATEVVPADSSQIREPAPPDKSVGERLLDVPEEILRLPVRAVKLISRGVVEAVYGSRTLYRIVESALAMAPVSGFFPVVGYGSNSGIEGGLGYTSRNVLLAGDHFLVKGSYSTHDYQDYELGYTSPDFFASRWGLGITAQYHRKPWESFYGIGNASDEDDEVAFTAEGSSVELSLPFRPHPTVTVAALGGWRQSNVFDGQDPDLVGDLAAIRSKFGLSPTHTRQAEFWAVGGSFRHDWRNHAGQPSYGGVEQITVTYNRGLGQSEDLEFVRSMVDVQHFLNLHAKRIIAVRVEASQIDKPEGAPALPFHLLNALGGSDDIRGYRTNRLVDYDYVYVTLEYRYPVWEGIDAFVFVDEGRVFRSLRDEFTFDDWHFSSGMGVRVFSRHKVNLKAMVAFGEEDARLYLDLDTEF